MTIKQVIQNEIFIMNVDEMIDKLKTERRNRKPAKPGFRYKNDWYDSMKRNNQLNRDFFLTNIESIWNKKSILSAEIRNVFIFVFVRFIKSVSY